MKASAAQSVCSVYDHLRNNSQRSDDYGAEDEKSEVMVSVVFSDHRCSSGSIVINDKDNINECGSNSDYNISPLKPNYVHLSESSCKSLTNCTCSGDSTLHRHKIALPPCVTSFNNSSTSYVTGTDTSHISRLMPEAIILVEKQFDIQTQASYVCEQVDMCNLHISNNTHFYGQVHQDNKVFCCKCEEYSNVLSNVSGIIAEPSRYSTLQTDLLTTDDGLVECSLSLNPSHFEPLDS